MIRRIETAFRSMLDDKDMTYIVKRAVKTMINPDDFDSSFDRLIKREYRTAEDFRFGVTRQGQAIGRKYRPQLAKIVEEQRAHGRPKSVWCPVSHAFRIATK
jgi:hypothetical protein